MKRLATCISLREQTIKCKLVLLTAYLLFALMMAGCAQSTTSARQEIVVGTGRIDQLLASVSPLNYLVFETMVEMDDEGNFLPLLAQEWTVSPDGKSYTFKLRQNVKFSDGSALTAQDVKNSLEHFRDSTLYHLIGNVEVIDDYTLKINLKKPVNFFLSELHFAGPVFKVKGAEGKDILGTGPFKLAEFKKDEQVVLEKNQGYWQGKVALDKVTFKVVPDANSRLMALKAGQLDIIGADASNHLSPEDIRGLKEDGRIVLMRGQKTGFRTVLLVVNPFREPTNDPLVRKAIRLAISPEELNNIYGETGRVIGGAVFPGTRWAHPGLEPPQQDLNGAKELLRQAEWKDTDGDGLVDREGQPLTLKFVVSRTNPLWPVVAELVQAQMKQAGIKVEIKQVELGAHMQALEAGEFHLSLKVDTGSARVPPDFQASYQSKPIGGWKCTLTANTTLDQVIARYTANLDEKQQAGLAHRIQEIVEEEATVATCLEEFRVIAVSKRVENFIPAPGWSSLRHLWQAGVKERA